MGAGFFAVSWEEDDQRQAKPFFGPEKVAVGVPADVGVLIHHLSHEFQKWVCRSEGIDLLLRDRNPEGPVIVLPVGRSVLLEAVCESLSTIPAFHDPNVEGIGLQNRLDPRCLAFKVVGRQLACFGLFNQVAVHLLMP